MTALAQETVNKLLDFSQKLDIGLLVSNIEIKETFQEDTNNSEALN